MTMRLIREMPLMLGLGIVAVSPVWAQSALSAGGFTGWSVTPTAKVQAWGTVSLAYDNEVVSGPVSRRYGTSGDNLVVGFGFLPHVEVSGRIASNTFNTSSSTNCFIQDCGIRDLSFNAKAGSAFDEDGLWHVAAGATDVGGQTGNFSSMYGVITYSPYPLDLSLGYGRRKSTALNISTSPLNGIFGSAGYRPLSWLQTHVEYADSKAWAGIRMFAPSDWLPQDWTAYIGVNVRLRGDDRTARSWFSTGVSIPLYKVPQTLMNNPVASERVSMLAPSVTSVQQVPLANASPASASPEPSPVQAESTKSVNPVTDDQLHALSEALKLKGFEDISVGHATDGFIAVRVNNASYLVNTADGLGAALGVIARHLSAQRAGYRLVLTQRQIAVVAVAGQADCLADWVDLAPFRCTAGELYTPGTIGLDALLAGSDWTVNGMAPSWKTPRLILQPVLRSALATDYRVFDYSLALRATLQQPLWAGAWAEVAGNAPMTDSRNFKTGQAFGNQRLTNQMDRYMVHQVFRVPVDKLLNYEGDSKTAITGGATAVTAHVAAGQIDANYRGTYAEMRWEPNEGLHRIGLEGGQFDRIQQYNRDLPAKSRLALVSYRYAFMPTQTYLELTAGQFLSNDRGAKLEIKQWFDDVSISLYIRRSKVDFADSIRTSAGIELSIPLTPRREMSPSNPIQVTGAAQWTHSIETLVRSQFNFVSWNLGVIPNISVLNQTFNFDRSSSTYFEENIQRIRSAAGKF